MSDDDIKVKVISPFEVDPRVLADVLYARTPRWRVLKRRRLRRERDRLARAGYTVVPFPSD